MRQLQCGAMQVLEKARYDKPPRRRPRGLVLNDKPPKLAAGNMVAAKGLEPPTHGL